MNTTSNTTNRRPIWLTLAATIIVSVTLPEVSAQVRTKQPDRGVYQPDGPTIYPAQNGVPASTRTSERDSYETRGDDDRRQTPASIEPIRIEPLMPAQSPTLHEVADPRSVSLQPIKFRSLEERPRALVGSGARVESGVWGESEVQSVSFEEGEVISNLAPSMTPMVGDPVLRNTTNQNRTWMPRYDGRHRPMGDETMIINGPSFGHGIGHEAWVEGDSYIVDGSMHDGMCGCDSCGMGSCDAQSCGIGCDGYACGGHCGNASLSFDPCRWFGSLELLLLWREGDSLPPLVTTSPAGTLIATAGQLPDATVLAGGSNAFDEITAGGRLTIGTWIDSCQSRSIVGRLWTATEEDYSFSARESINSGILAIPTTLAGAANAVLVAFPDTTESAGRFGSVNVSASSNVYGADVSVRQFWTGGLGTTYDVLYGYQFMRLDEDLSLQTSSTITQQQLPLEVGNNLTTSDTFDTRNEFHGGQLGLAGRYREGCWSFDFLGKVGFGRLSREFERRGSSTITTDTPPANTEPTGILVNDVNRGTFNDSTFGWVPEFDVSVGWHKYPRFDVTFGYNIIAMTDAIRLSGIMDPGNATDTPLAGSNSNTFYLHGIHFGIRHVY